MFFFFHFYMFHPSRLTVSITLPQTSTHVAPFYMSLPIFIFHKEFLAKRWLFSFFFFNFFSLFDVSCCVSLSYTTWLVYLYDVHILFFSLLYSCVSQFYLYLLISNCFMKFAIFFLKKFGYRLITNVTLWPL